MSGELFPAAELEKIFSRMAKKKRQPRRRKHVVPYKGKQLELFEVPGRTMDGTGDLDWNFIEGTKLCESKAHEFYWLHMKHRIFRLELPTVKVVKISARERAGYEKYHPKMFSRGGNRMEAIR